MKRFVLCAIAALCIASAAHADTEDDRGGPGESCRARADCKKGLRCIDNKCADDHVGESCQASSECGSLKCIDNKCVNPNARPVQQPVQPVQPVQPIQPVQPVRPVQQQPVQPVEPVQHPPPVEPIGGVPIEPPSHAFEDWLEFKPTGMRPFVGFTLAVGLLNGGYTASEGTLWASGADGAFLFALRGGVLIGRHEIALEIAPFTNAWDLAVGKGPAFEANVTYGFLFPLVTRARGSISWPFRVGIGVLAGGDNTNGNVFFEARVDVIGVAIRIGHVVIDLHAPSFRYALTNGHVDGIAVNGATTNYLQFYFGTSVSYLF